MALKTQTGYVGFTPVPPTLSPLRVGGIVVLSGSVTGATTVAAAAIETSGSAQNYDCSTNNSLTVYVSEDNATTYLRCGPITVAGATVATTTAAEVVVDLNANTMFAKYMTADVNGTSVRITTDAVGPNTAFYVTGTANTPLGFTAVATGSANNGTGTVASLSLISQDSTGQAIALSPITITLYAGSTGDTKDATGIINRATVGGIISGEHTNTAVCETDRNGILTLEIGDPTGGAVDCHLEATDTGSTRVLTGKDAGGDARISVTTGT